MVHARQAPVRCPGFLGVRLRWTQGNVGFLGANVYPAAAILTYAFAPHFEFRKRGLQETDHPLDITYSEVRMFKPDSHCTPPMRLTLVQADRQKSPWRTAQEYHPPLA